MHTVPHGYSGKRYLGASTSIIEVQLEPHSGRLLDLEGKCTGYKTEPDVSIDSHMRKPKLMLVRADSEATLSIVMHNQLIIFDGPIKSTRRINGLDKNERAVLVMMN